MEGLEKVVDAINDHRALLDSSGQLQRQRESNARHQVLATTRAILLQRIQAATRMEDLEALVRRVADRTLDPHSAAEELADALRE